MKTYNNFTTPIKINSVKRDLPSKYSTSGKRTDYFFDTEIGNVVFYAVPGKNQEFINALEDALAGKNSGVFDKCSYAISDAGKIYLEASPYFQIVDENKE